MKSLIDRKLALKVWINTHLTCGIGNHRVEHWKGVTFCGRCSRRLMPDGIWGKRVPFVLLLDRGIELARLEDLRFMARRLFGA